MTYSIEYQDGAIFPFCAIEEQPDFSSYIKFAANKAEIHVHPTGHLNFRHKGEKHEMFIRDPYLFEGSQPIAVLEVSREDHQHLTIKNPKNSVVGANIRLSSNESKLVLMISKHPILVANRDVAIHHTPDMYNIVFYEKTFSSSMQQFRRFGQTQLHPFRSELEKCEILEKVRYVQSHQLRSKGTRMRDPNFQNLSEDQKREIFEQIENSPMIVARAARVFEAIFSVEMRIPPSLNIVGKRGLVRGEKILINEDRLGTVRAKFFVRRNKGNHFEDNLDLIESYMFEAEL
jgi:hypothetical protein